MTFLLHLACLIIYTTALRVANGLSPDESTQLFHVVQQLQDEVTTLRSEVKQIHDLEVKVTALAAENDHLRTKILHQQSNAHSPTARTPGAYSFTVSQSEPEYNFSPDDSAKLNFSDVITNVWSAWDVTENEFRVPVPGLYFFSYHSRGAALSNQTNTGQTDLTVNGVSRGGIATDENSSNMSMSLLLTLAEGDIVSLVLAAGRGVFSAYFTGFLLLWDST